ncbi:hypothetical protein RTP6_000701 [Batrachochytrium dendrobatidis]
MLQQPAKMSMYEQLSMTQSKSTGFPASHTHFVSREPAGVPFKPYKYAIRSQTNAGAADLEADSSLAKGRMPQFRADRPGPHVGNPSALHMGEMNPSSQQHKHTFMRAVTDEDSYLLHRSSDMAASIFDMRVQLNTN